MYEFRYLLDRFWVTRADHKGLYFSVKRALPNYRRLVNEQLGWNLIVNESVIKLEKVPPKAMAWMDTGIPGKAGLLPAVRYAAFLVRSG